MSEAGPVVSKPEGGSVFRPRKNTDLDNRPCGGQFLRPRREVIMANDRIIQPLDPKGLAFQ